MENGQRYPEIVKVQRGISWSKYLYGFQHFKNQFWTKKKIPALKLNTIAFLSKVLLG